MFYIAQFQRNRQDYLKQHRRLRSLVDENFALCSHEYSEKFPSRLPTPSAGYLHNQTLVFLSRLSTSETKSNQQPTGIVQENKDSTMTFVKCSGRSDDRQISADNGGRFSARWHDQLPNSTYRLNHSRTKGNHWPNSVSLLFPTLIEPHRCTTAPLVPKENNCSAVPTRVKSTILCRSPTPLLSSQLVDSFEDTESLTDSAFFQLDSTMQKINSPSIPHQPDSDANNENSSLDLSQDPSSPVETTIKVPDQRTTLRRKSLCTVNGFQHIANLGTWQRNSKHTPIESTGKSQAIDHDEDPLHDRALFNSSTPLYDYQSPFSEEFDQAISFQAQVQITGSNNEWSLKDFYRDAKTQLDPESSTKPVFEKCLKLARLQANTIRWEQRRRQNLNMYNRLIKNIPLDASLLNLNGSFPLRNSNEREPRDINELRRELRCTECKRLACLGNCAPGQEYHQYKRSIPLSSLPIAREQVRCKVNVRPQRSTSDLRPRSTQQITRENKFKFEQSNLNRMAVVPLFAPEPPVKRPQKKYSSSFLPSKSFRSQRKETLTLVSTHKILS